MEEILKIANLTKDFGALRVLDKVSLSVMKKEIHAIIGPNGAGKTTLFNLVCGDLKPSEGDIYLFGHRVNPMPPYKRIRLGLGRSFQICKLFSGLTLHDNLLLTLQHKTVMAGLFRSVSQNALERCDFMLEQFDLQEKHDVQVSSLSHGEKRLAEIAMALALYPKLLMLDEPTCGLTMDEIAKLTGIIKSLPQDTTLVVIAHDLDLVFNIAHRITVLNYGKILATGNCEQIKQNREVIEVYTGSLEHGTHDAIKS